MKISLVIALYNGERYIIEQLESIKNQTVKIDEVILVDDMSTDNTYHIVQQYIQSNKLNHWYLFKNKNNLGYRKNFIEGLKKVTGDIIFLSDQDDRWSLHKVETILDIIIKNPQVLCIGSSFNFIDEYGNQFAIPLKKGYSNQNLITYPIEKGALKQINIQFLHQRNFCQGCTMAFKKVIKNEFLKVTEVKNPHDWELNLIACSHNGCYFYNEPLIDYRIHQNNTIGLEEQISGFGDGYAQKRVNERIDFLNNELPILQFALQLEGFNQNQKKYLHKKYNYIINRINMIEHHAVLKIIVYYVLGNYYRKGNFRTMIGDILSALK